MPYALALTPATLDPCPTSYSLAEIVEMIKLSHPGRLVVLLAVICCALTAARATLSLSRLESLEPSGLAITGRCT